MFPEDQLLKDICCSSSVFDRVLTTGTKSNDRANVHTRVQLLLLSNDHCQARYGDAGLEEQEDGFLD